MIKNNFYPLRTIVGPSIPILQMGVLSSWPLTIVSRYRADITYTVYDDIYSNFLPDIISVGTTYRPIAGMSTMPIPNSSLIPFEDIPVSEFINIFRNPPDIPFPESDPVSSIFGYQEDNFIEMQLGLQEQEVRQQVNSLHSGRDRSYSFLIQLEREALVGGICFSGYPFILSRIENTLEGMTVGNFGLPREISLTPLPSSRKSFESMTGLQRSQFIDSEFAYTRQEIISHSGLNYLTIDPVKTNQFMLSITDLPFIPRIIDLDARRDDANNPLLVKGFKGFAFAYLYFFEYKEQTRRYARLHSGLLGVKPEYPHLPKADGDNTREDILRRAFPEYEYCFFDWADPGTVTGYITDETGGVISGVVITIKGTGWAVTTDSAGQFSLTPVKADDILIISASGYNPVEVPVRGRPTINVQLPSGNSDSADAVYEGVYCLFTAHSIFGQRRLFDYYYAELDYPKQIQDVLSYFTRRKDKETNFSECFVSDLLQPGEKVTLYIQQGEEYERCVAGLKALFFLVPDDTTTERVAERLANFLGFGQSDRQLSHEERTFIEDGLALVLNLPPEINFCERIGVRVYELDPVGGVSPASVNLGSKYSTLLVDTTIDDFADAIFSLVLKGIPFRRTSSSKYFALELTNRGEKNGQVAIHSLQMMRSAHVSVQPRAARTQQIKAMHYRLIGAELADDFSKLGNEGFNFSIDRLAAGQTKNVLYSAMSLLDLLHTGNARIHSNVRRRAAEFEMVENFQEAAANLPPQLQDYQINRFDRDNLTRPNEDNRVSRGWRRSETGEGVTWNSPSNRPQDYPSSIQESAFEIYGTNENRVHSSLLFPDTTNVDWATIAALGNMFKVITDPTQGIETGVRQLSNGGMRNLRSFIDALDPNGLLIRSYKASASENFNQDQLVKDFERTWKGISTSANNLRVAGIISSSQSPVGLSAIAGNVLDDVISSIENLSDIAGDIRRFLGDGDITRLGDLLNDMRGLLDLVIIVGGLGGPGSPLKMVPLLNGLTLGLTSGVGVNISSGPNLIFPSYQMTASSGSTGSINKSANKTGYSYNQMLNVGYDKSVLGNSEVKRIISRRELLGRDNERVRGAEVMWQGKVQDIITGTIPLNITLPATATKMNFRTADDALRVRFNSGFSPSVEVDFWFELTEETIRDDN